MKKFIAEFKEFAFKGNVLDMAIGVIIGGAFGKIVTALVENIISPFITLLTGAAKLSDWSFVLKEAVGGGAEAGGTDAVVLNFGAFLQAVIDFFIIAICIFLILKAIMKAKEKFDNLKKKEEEAAEEEAEQTELSVLLEIKDLLEKEKK